MKHLGLVTRQPFVAAQSDITLGKVIDTIGTVLDFVTAASTGILTMWGVLIDAADALITAKTGTPTP